MVLVAFAGMRRQLAIVLLIAGVICLVVALLASSHEPTATTASNNDVMFYVASTVCFIAGFLLFTRTRVASDSPLVNDPAEPTTGPEQPAEEGGDKR